MLNFIFLSNVTRLQFLLQIILFPLKNIPHLSDEVRMFLRSIKETIFLFQIYACVFLIDVAKIK